MSLGTASCVSLKSQYLRDLESFAFVVLLHDRLLSTVRPTFNQPPKAHNHDD